MAKRDMLTISINEEIKKILKDFKKAGINTSAFIRECIIIKNSLINEDFKKFKKNVKRIVEEQITKSN